MHALISDFALRHGLRVQHDPDDDTVIIRGRLGNVFEYGGNLLGVMFIPAGMPRARKWNAFKQAALEAGMTLRQDADAEGSLSFNPAHTVQANLAIRIAGVNRKRQMSAEQKAGKAALAVRMTQIRVQSNVKNGGLAV